MPYDLLRPHQNPTWIGLNPLRTFDCKVERCRAVLDEAPRISDHLCPECREHFDAVLALVRAAGLEPRLDFRLVRGLDYYTPARFEIVPAALYVAVAAA